MAIDNDVYNREAHGWWHEDNPLNMLHGSVTPARFAYFHEVLTRRLGIELPGLKVLDVGCGGGFLAEEFARLGCRVIGVDPSAASLETARAHAEANGLDIDYRVGIGEQLPVPDNDFHLVYCCDVLEHVTDLDAVIRETSRALRPGGVYCFDTVNRTVRSKLLAIKIMQEWRMTRLLDTSLHEWSMFIKPRELDALLSRHGLQMQDMVGLAPRTKNPAAILGGFVLARRGQITYAELSRRLDFGPVRSKSMSYMGYARLVS